jgi:cytoskeletal protein RodZ
MSSRRPENLGEKLKFTRKKKGLSLVEVEEETKVRTKYLEALEKGQYEILPSNVYAIGFLTKFSEMLGLDRDRMIELFKKERGQIEEHSSKLAPDKRIKEPFFTLTPRILTIIIILFLIIGVLGYIGYSVRLFTAPPNLEIGSPSTDTIIQSQETTVAGKTDSGVTLTINNQIVFIDDKGNFSENIKLQPGLNTIEIKAVNRLKKESSRVIKVLAEYQEEIPESPKPDSSSANEESPPIDNSETSL